MINRRGALALALTGTLALAACGGKAPEKGSGPVKITVWSWKPASDGLAAVAKDFEQTHPGIKVDVQAVGNPAIWDKITIAMAAGGKGLADVLHIGVDYLPGYMDKFSGGLADLRKLGADKHKDAFAKGLWPTVTGKDGGVYAMPWEVNPVGFFYRADLFKKAGIDPEKIQTWDDAIEAGKTLKEKTGAFLIGLNKPAAGGADMDFFQSLLQQQGAFYFNQQDEVTLSSPPAIQAMTLIKKMNDAGIVADTSGENTAKQLISGGKLAVLPWAAWAVSYIPEMRPEQKGLWRVMQPPAIAAGGKRTAIVNSTHLSISGTSSHQAEAFAFVEYALTKPEVVTKAFKEGGVFPALTEAYSDPAFAAPQPYFGGQPALKTFVDALTEGADATYYSGDYARALKIASDAQTKVLLKGADPAAALTEAATLLAQQTNRKLAG
ncbi:ABC transporter substrate-binding protein [Nonomuraea muscovyensis]|uniref:Lactose/L-arabinose transport system substrate-binding protein n=1 Tax=Nonomuraea muscovyensis TaxID=1124761 RepID=A0A7X0EZG5_9ACTN|nr:sugar ABC transporter substrate-binding protein [Nonomuraea muscovyensis]MBB6346701.1 lactose/L-arabinose transport system substrate-binding protein [Nonomuraea muscovyensis]